LLSPQYHLDPTRHRRFDDKRSTLGTFLQCRISCLCKRSFLKIHSPHSEPR
jgi:hypothetical protein